MGVGGRAELPSWLDVVRSSCTSMFSAGGSSIVLLILVMLVALRLIWFVLVLLTDKTFEGSASAEVDSW